MTREPRRVHAKVKHYVRKRYSVLRVRPYGAKVVESFTAESDTIRRFLKKG